MGFNYITKKSVTNTREGRGIFFISIIEKHDYFSITAALLWGVNYVAEIPESAFLVIRFTSAVAILFLYLLVTPRRESGSNAPILEKYYAWVFLE